jgi:hypothetical protein
MVVQPEEAVAGFAAALDALIDSADASLACLDDAGVLGVLQGFERVRNRMAVLDHRLVGECERRDLPARQSQPSVARFLAPLLRLSPAEANRRVRAAEACSVRRSLTGEPLDPIRPVLAAAQAAGEVSTEQVDMVVRALRPYDQPGFDPDDVAAGERLLAGYATTFGPQQLKPLVDRVVSAIDPDGSVPDDALNAERRHFTMRSTKDGAYVGEFRLTGSAGAKLSAVLGPLSRPRTSVVGTCTGPDGTEQPVREVDPRGLPQRRHDALEEVCDRLLRSGTLPDSGGTPTTVVVTMSAEDLQARTGTATTSDGTSLSVAQLLGLADEAEIIPTVLNASGAVLDLGRTRRLASPSQTCALAARDGGCSFPGCGQPPEGCERHHIVAWVDGGRTDLDNLTLLCGYHHHNFAERGWTCRINPDRLPEWTPPRWVDPEQKSLLNLRIRAQLLVRQPQSTFALSG